MAVSLSIEIILFNELTFVSIEFRHSFNESFHLFNEFSGLFNELNTLSNDGPKSFDNLSIDSDPILPNRLTEIV